MSEQTWEAPPEGSICWVEIPARNADKLKEFYSALFPSWKFKASPSGGDHKVHSYSFERPDGLTGGIVEMPEGCPEHSQSLGSGFTNYYLVNDVDEAITRIEKLGGKLVLPKMEQGSGGLYANLVDTEGNRFGVYQWLGNTPSQEAK